MFSVTCAVSFAEVSTRCRSVCGLHTQVHVCVRDVRQSRVRGVDAFHWAEGARFGWDHSLTYLVIDEFFSIIIINDEIPLTTKVGNLKL